MSKIKVGVDVDDVLLDTLATAWLPVYNERYNDNLKPEDITEWDMSKFVSPEHKSDIYDVLKEPETWNKIQPVKFSQKYLKMLNEDNNIELYIVSATFPLTPNEKWERFIHFFPFIDPKNIIRIYNKSLLNIDVMIDDNADNLKSGDILYNQPHNQSINDEKNGFYRVYDWMDVYENIQFVLPFRKERKNNDNN